MPFKSEAQRRWMHAAEARGEVPKGTAARWEEHTGDQKLPERVEPKTAKFRDHVKFTDEVAGRIGIPNLDMGQLGGERRIRHYTVGGEPAGFMVYSVHPETGMHVVEVSKIHEPFKGLGLGKKMYGDLVRDKGVVMSDIVHGTSREATRVWDSLKRRGRAEGFRNQGLFGLGQTAVVGGGKQPIHVAVNHQHDLGDAVRQAKSLASNKWWLDRAHLASLATGTALGAYTAGEGNRPNGALYGLGGSILGSGAGWGAAHLVASKLGLNPATATSVGAIMGGNLGGAAGGGVARLESILDDYLAKKDASDKPHTGDQKLPERVESKKMASFVEAVKEAARRAGNTRPVFYFHQAYDNTGPDQMMLVREGRPGRVIRTTTDVISPYMNRRARAFSAVIGGQAFQEIAGGTGHPFSVSWAPKTKRYRLEINDAYARDNRGRLSPSLFGVHKDHDISAEEIHRIGRLASRDFEGPRQFDPEVVEKALAAMNAHRRRQKMLRYGAGGLAAAGLLAGGGYLLHKHLQGKQEEPVKTSSEDKPWNKEAPKGKKKSTLTDEQRDAARRRAAEAGRPYPNLIDNMWASGRGKSASDEALARFGIKIAISDEMAQAAYDARFLDAMKSHSPKDMEVLRRHESLQAARTARRAYNKPPKEPKPRPPRRPRPGELTEEGQMKRQRRQLRNVVGQKKNVDPKSVITDEAGKRILHAPVPRMEIPRVDLPPQLQAPSVSGLLDNAADAASDAATHATLPPWARRSLLAAGVLGTLGAGYGLYSAAKVPDYNYTVDPVSDDQSAEGKMAALAQFGIKEAEVIQSFRTSKDGRKKWRVSLEDGKYRCTCPDYMYRHAGKDTHCKHIKQAIGAGRGEQAMSSKQAFWGSPAELLALLTLPTIAGAGSGALTGALTADKDRLEAARLGGLGGATLGAGLTLAAKHNLVPQMVMAGLGGAGIGALAGSLHGGSDEPVHLGDSPAKTGAEDACILLGLHYNYAEKLAAGAWQRAEGKNPEGGLNAKGRASLKAEGHDIKPPVSSDQAKKSPKAAARRKSFCARMGGMPGPMKKDNGEPTRKALALRKWDC